MAILISAIVCTYNHADFLSHVLRSLIEQTLSADNYEVIVVDNNSIDNTKEIVREFQRKHNDFNIRYFFEMQQGLSYARNTGFRVARGNYVAYIDDDARASKNWLEIAMETFETVEPTPVCIGGPIYPFYNSPKPEWYEDKYGTISCGSKPKFFTKRSSLFGSNMIFKKEILENIGGFNVEFGMQGDCIMTGEENELFRKIWQEEKYINHIFYTPDLVVYHFVPAHKMTSSYCLKRHLICGYTSYLLHNRRGIMYLLVYRLKALIHLFKPCIKAVIQIRKYRSYNKWLVECVCPIMLILGCLGFRVKMSREN